MGNSVFMTRLERAFVGIFHGEKSPADIQELWEKKDLSEKILLVGGSLDLDLEQPITATDLASQNLIRLSKSLTTAEFQNLIHALVYDD